MPVHIVCEYFRKCFHAAYYYLDDPQCSVQIATIDWNAVPDGSSEYKGAIPVHQFIRHVAELHADGDIGFSKEYEAIQTESTQDEYSSEHSQHPDNRPKNRYLNIIACKIISFQSYKHVLYVTKYLLVTRNVYIKIISSHKYIWCLDRTICIPSLHELRLILHVYCKY